MRDFPQELVEKIIDCGANHWSDGNATVKTCGLVSSGWVNRSRYHLFSTVTLTAKNLRSFVDTVTTSSFPILAFIRVLEVHFIGRFLDVSLLRQLYGCPNLTTIRIAIIDIGGSRWEDSWGYWLESDELLHSHLRSWCANSASLSRFEIRFNGFRVSLPLDTMILLMSCFPCLDSVVIYDPFRFIDTDEYPTFAPTHLANLEISASEHIDVFFSWLLSLPVPPLLKSLKFEASYRSHRDTFQSVHTYIQRAGGELQSLSLEIYSPWNYTIKFYRQIFQHTPKLQNLSMSCATVLNINEALSSLPASDWSCINIRVEIYAPESDTQFWGEIDASLAEPRFRSLRLFSISPEPLDRIQDLLPLAAARRIL
ncbi:hypothetical protein B0H19DRAFT_1266871 [Mycena capillaripes]|nr:hypothetical protein B0H19DRAFT_1266871 [Mycena capillaripes]